MPLNEEIETLDNYLCLQQMRFEEAFTYHITQPEGQDLSAVMLPPMLIQPYVENAILHGIDLHTGNGNIDILFHLEEDILRVSISDTGKSQYQMANTTHRSLSGTISRERMYLLGKKSKRTQHRKARRRNRCNLTNTDSTCIMHANYKNDLRIVNSGIPYGNTIYF